MQQSYRTSFNRPLPPLPPLLLHATTHALLTMFPSLVSMFARFCSFLSSVSSFLSPADVDLLDWHSADYIRHRKRELERAIEELKRVDDPDLYEKEIEHREQLSISYSEQLQAATSAAEQSSSRVMLAGN